MYIAPNMHTCVLVLMWRVQKLFHCSLYIVKVGNMAKQRGVAASHAHIYCFVLAIYLHWSASLAEECVMAYHFWEDFSSYSCTYWRTLVAGCCCVTLKELLTSPLYRLIELISNQNSSSSSTRGGATYCIIKGMVESSRTGTGVLVAIFISLTVYIMCDPVCTWEKGIYHKQKILATFKQLLFCCFSKNIICIWFVESI